MQPLPPLEWLSRLFDYDPGTGVVFERTRRAFRTKVGAPVGFKDGQRYLRTKVKFPSGETRTVAVHRIAYALGSQTIPPDQYVIDHINRCRDDNRFENLRLLTPRENAWNVSHRKGRSLPKGVVRAGRRFVVRTNFAESKDKSAGMFLTSIEAARAYDAAVVAFASDVVTTNEQLGLIENRPQHWWDILHIVKVWDKQGADYETLIDRLSELVER